MPRVKMKQKKQVANIEEALTKEMLELPVFHKFYEDSPERVRLYIEGIIVDIVPGYKERKYHHIGAKIDPSSNSEELWVVSHKENKPIGRLPLGTILNAAYSAINKHIEDGIDLEKHGNNIWTLLAIIDDLLESEAKMTKAHIYVVLANRSYRPIRINSEKDYDADDENVPFSYIIDCLTDALYYSIAHLPKLLYPKGAYLKQCSVCDKLFFSSDKRTKRCYFLSSDKRFEGKTCKEIIDERGLRERAEKAELDDLLHRLRQKYNARGGLWRDDLNKAYRAEKKRLNDCPDMNKKLLAWVKDYDSKDNYAKKRKRR